MNDFRRSENPTKPTTSDMTVSKILDDFGSAVVDVALKLYDDPDYKFEKDHDAAHKQALAAIEAIRKVDMEAVIGENEQLEPYPSNSNVNTKRRGRNALRAEQRQRMAERLNNTEEV